MNRPFLISIYALTALSGGMIAFAEEIPFPSGLTLPLAILAYFFNEREQRIRIRTFWANILGVVAFLVAATELLVAGFSEAGFAAEGRLLSGAHLLSYLVWIALFQDKHGRQYWWLMALGVMQVAVGAILSESCCCFTCFCRCGRCPFFRSTRHTTALKWQGRHRQPRFLPRHRKATPLATVSSSDSQTKSVAPFNWILTSNGLTAVSCSALSRHPSCRSASAWSSLF